MFKIHQKVKKMFLMCYDFVICQSVSATKKRQKIGKSYKFWCKRPPEYCAVTCWWFGKPILKKFKQASFFFKMLCIHGCSLLFFFLLVTFLTFSYPITNYDCFFFFTSKITFLLIIEITIWSGLLSPPYKKTRLFWGYFIFCSVVFWPDERTISWF